MAFVGRLLGLASGSDSNTLLPTQNLKKIEAILGYKFIKPKLLEEAMTHSSYYPSPNYERLEFIGDAVINWLVAKQLFLAYPNLDKGELTRLRSVNTDNEKLARVSIKHGLYSYLIHKMPSVDEQIQNFNEEIMYYPVHSNKLIDTPKFLADIVESTAGAVFMDSNCSLDTVWKVFNGLLEPLIRPGALGVQPTTELKELCEKRRMSHKFEEEPLLDENFTISVLVDDRRVGTGTGRNKDVARNRAAKAALDNLKGNLGRGYNY